MSTRTRPDLTSLLQEAFAEFLGLEPAEVATDRSIDELGMDSLTAAQLAVDIEERLGVSVFLEDLTGRETIDGLAASLLGERDP
jgi:acyl carrier protein